MSPPSMLKRCTLQRNEKWRKTILRTAEAYGSAHQLWELSPASGLFDFQFYPAGQRCGTVIEEHDAAGLRKRKTRRERAVIDRVLLQDTAVIRVGRVEPDRLRRQTATPP